jgi:hypothetical protein
MSRNIQTKMNVVKNIPTDMEVKFENEKQKSYLKMHAGMNSNVLF